MFHRCHYLASNCELSVQPNLIVWAVDAGDLGNLGDLAAAALGKLQERVVLSLDSLLRQQDA